MGNNASANLLKAAEAFDFNAVKIELDEARADSAASLTKLINNSYEKYFNSNILQILFRDSLRKAITAESPFQFDNAFNIIERIINEPSFDLAHTDDAGENLLHSLANFIADVEIKNVKLVANPAIQDFFAKVSKLVVDRFKSSSATTPTNNTLIDAKRNASVFYKLTEGTLVGGLTPLSIACATLNTNLVSLLLETKLCDLTDRDTNGDTPLHFLAQASGVFSKSASSPAFAEFLETRQLKILDAIFSSGLKYDLNAKNEKKQQNVLHAYLEDGATSPSIAKSLSGKVVTELLSGPLTKIDVNARCAGSMHATPLYLVCDAAGDRADLVDMLFAAGANQKLDAWFYTGDPIARRKRLQSKKADEGDEDGDDAEDKKLDKNDPSDDTKRIDQETCLTVSLKKGNIRIANLLLKSGCDQTCIKKVEDSPKLGENLDKVDQSLLKK